LFSPSAQHILSASKHPISVSPNTHSNSASSNSTANTIPSISSQHNLPAAAPFSFSQHIPSAYYTPLPSNTIPHSFSAPSSHSVSAPFSQPSATAAISSTPTSYISGHFKQPVPTSSHSPSLPPSTAYYTSIESSKGIYSTYMCMENYTINIVCSDYLSISALNKYSKNVNLADLIAILGSIDFVLGSVDTIVFVFV